MLILFAKPREPAGAHAAPTVLPNNGGTAAGSVGAAVPLSLLAAGCLAGCADVRHGAYFPETLTITSSFGHDAHGGWDRQNVGANFTWRLKPLPVAPATGDPHSPESCNP